MELIVPLEFWAEQEGNVPTAAACAIKVPDVRPPLAVSEGKLSNSGFQERFFLNLCTLIR